MLNRNPESFAKGRQRPAASGSLTSNTVSFALMRGEHWESEDLAAVTLPSTPGQFIGPCRMVEPSCIAGYYEHG